MDQESIRNLDDATPGDILEVHFRPDVHETRVIEGEFGGFARSRRGGWYLVILKKAAIRTIDLQMVRITVHAGCL